MYEISALPHAYSHESLHPDADKPTMIVARTVKGKGVSFAENSVSHHYWKPKPEELSRALEDLQ